MRKVFDGGAVIAPLPAALVTTSDGRENGVRNVFTAAWVGIANTRPPIAYVSVRPERFSYVLIKSSGEFVINLTSSKMAKSVDWCGMKSGRDTDKFGKFNVVESITVSPPTIAECPVSLECKVRQSIDLGSHTMFLADIVKMTADKRIVDSKGKINFEQAGLMAYAHGGYYALGRRLGDFGFSVRRKAKRK